VPGQRLGDIHPFLLPAAGRLTFFLCRWPDDATISVSLPRDVTPVERHAIETALQAWEGAGIGVRFATLEGGPAAIEIELEDEVVTGAGEDTGNAVVDCQVAPLSAQGAGDEVAEARLVSARLRIARKTNADMIGNLRPLTPAELTGAVLHELGHALGFEGHVHHGDTILVRETEQVEHAGKALLAGEPFEDPTVRALYRAPDGAVLARVPVEPWRTDLVDRMARLAEQHDLAGPFVRVGESGARIFWRDDAGREYGLLVPRLERLLYDPTQLLVIPEARTRRALPRSGDRRPTSS
jgi:hypothetical protein